MAFLTVFVCVFVQSRCRKTKPRDGGESQCDVSPAVCKVHQKSDFGVKELHFCPLVKRGLCLGMFYKLK